MNEMKNETANENWSQSASEVAKHSSLSFSLSGWPAAATLISIPAANSEPKRSVRRSRTAAMRSRAAVS